MLWRSAIGTCRDRASSLWQDTQVFLHLFCCPSRSHPVISPQTGEHSINSTICWNRIINRARCPFGSMTECLSLYGSSTLDNLHLTCNKLSNSIKKGYGCRVQTFGDKTTFLQTIKLWTTNQSLLTEHQSSSVLCHHIKSEFNNTSCVSSSQLAMCMKHRIQATTQTAHHKDPQRVISIILVFSTADL